MWKIALRHESNRALSCPALQSLILFTLVRGLNSAENSIQEVAFWQSAFKGLLRVNHGLGYGVNAILSDKIRKLSGLNAIGCDELALHCKLMGQAHRLRAMRSGGGNEDFKMKGLAQAGKLLFAFRLKPGFSF